MSVFLCFLYVHRQTISGCAMQSRRHLTVCIIAGTAA